MGFVHLVFTNLMFFRFSFFYLSLLFLFLVFGFLKGWCAKKQNDEINMAESDVEFYITGLQSSLIALLHCSDVYTVW